MKIPQILSDASIKTGPTGPMASADSFGMQEAEAVNQLSRAGRAVTAGIVDVAGAVKERQRIDDMDWLGATMEAEKAKINTWMADPINHTRPDFAQQTEKLLQESLQSGVSSARNKSSRVMFTSAFRSFASERYEAAVTTAARTRINGAVDVVEQQIQGISANYRKARAIPNVDAGKSILDDLKHLEFRISSGLERLAPKAASSLRAKMYTEAAYATMDYDPDLAESIIKDAPIDEQDKRTLRKQIENAGFTKNAAEVEAFSQIRANSIASAELGKRPDKIGLEIYQSYYPRDTAQALKMRDDALIDTYNTAFKTVDDIAGLAPRYQNAELGLLYQKASTEQDQKVLEIVSRKLNQNQELFEKNRVSWMQQFNPVVNAAARKANMAEEGERGQAVKELYDLTLQFQGPAPEGSPHEKYYLDLPAGDRHLMTIEEAEKNAYTINQGSAKQALDTIRQVLANYPDEKHQNIAFNDMVSLPQGSRAIKQEYQLAFLNNQAPWIKDYLGAQTADNLKTIAPDKLSEYESALEGNSDWLRFSHAVIGDNFQRGDELAGFKKGILSYAYARAAATGQSPKAAIREAADRLITEELGFTSVNGQTLMVMRDRGPGKPRRTPDEIRQMGNRMTLALQFIDPREIKLDDAEGRPLFPILDNAGTEMVKMQALRDAITQRATFKTSPDGQSVSLYYQDGNNRFELRDKNNRAFTIHLDDLLETDIFNTRKISLSGFTIPTHPGVKGVGTGQQGTRTYDLVNQAPSWSMFGRTMTTNWPSIPNINSTNTAPLIKREDRK